MIHHGSPVPFYISPTGGCCPSAARTHFTTAAPKRRAHLSKDLPAWMVVWVVGAQAGLVDRKDARVQCSGTVEVALLTKMHPWCTAVLWRFRVERRRGRRLGVPAR
jgi:hypothetical protein